MGTLISDSPFLGLESAAEQIDNIKAWLRRHDTGGQKENRGTARSGVPRFPKQEPSGQQVHAGWLSCWFFVGFARDDHLLFPAVRRRIVHGVFTTCQDCAVEVKKTAQAISGSLAH